MRSASPRVYDSRVVWAGRSRVLQRKPSNSVGASFRIVCGNSQVGGGYVPPSIAAALLDAPADRPPYVVADHPRIVEDEDNSDDDEREALNDDDREAFNRETSDTNPASQEQHEVENTSEAVEVVANVPAPNQSNERKRSASASPPAAMIHKLGRLAPGLPFVPSPLPYLRRRLNSTPANVRDLKLLFEFGPPNNAPSPVVHALFPPASGHNGHLNPDDNCIDSLVSEADSLIRDVPSSLSALPLLTRFEDEFPNYDGMCDNYLDESADVPHYVHSRSAPAVLGGPDSCTEQCEESYLSLPP